MSNKEDLYDIEETDREGNDIEEYISSDGVTEEGMVSLLSDIPSDLEVRRLIDRFVDTVHTDLSASEKKKVNTRMKESIQMLRRNNQGASQALFPLSKSIPNHPINIDLLIPNGYILNKDRGIYLIGPDGRSVEVSPYIVLPCEVVIDPSDTTGSRLLRLVKWDKNKNKWVYHPRPISVDKVTTARELMALNRDGVVVLEDDQKKHFATFFARIINANEMLDNLKKNTVIRQCGWTDDNKFFPFTTDNTDESMMFISNPGTSIHSIVDIVKKDLPRG